MLILTPEMERYREIAREIFLPFYSDTMPGHGPNHPEIVCDNYLNEVETVQFFSEPFDEREIIRGIVAAYGHDTDMHRSLRFRIDDIVFRDYEHRSAYRTYQEGMRAGLDEAEIVIHASRLVASTHANSSCVTKNQRAFRRADIRNVGMTYDPFVETSDAFYEEYLMSKEDDLADGVDNSKAKKEYVEWFDEIACRMILVPLLKPDLSYGEAERGPSGKSRFQENCYANIQRRRKELGLQPLPQEPLS